VPDDVGIQFTSRAWFIMLAVSFMLITSIWLALSRYGRIKLGKDNDEPEFSTVSWLTMLFAAGMGVGLLYWGTAEPLTHYLLIAEYEDPREAAGMALFVTSFHWGLHAWAIYALTGLVIAYFCFRLGCPSLVNAPFKTATSLTLLSHHIDYSTPGCSEPSPIPQPPNGNSSHIQRTPTSIDHSRSNELLLLAMPKPGLAYTTRPALLPWMGLITLPNSGPIQKLSSSVSKSREAWNSGMT